MDRGVVLVLRRILILFAALAAPLAAGACGGDRESAIEPDRFDLRGPHAVGVTTLNLGDRQVEVYYPVDATSVSGRPTDSYKAADAFPEAFRAMVPPAMNGSFDVGAVRDASGSGKGPFPVVIYSHGFGGYRQVATFYLAHLASWGFVVASADHLERGIVAVASGRLENASKGIDLDDVSRTIALLRAEGAASTSPLEGIVNADRVGITGHSAGAQTALRAAGSNGDIDAFVSISGGLSLMGEPSPPMPAKPALVVAGADDQVVIASKSAALFAALGSPKYHVEIENAGHNSFTDSCPVILERGGLESLRPMLGTLIDLAQDGCNAGQADPYAVQLVLGHYSTAFFLTYLTGEDHRATLLAGPPASVGSLSLSALAHA
ncbi:MAG: hypothetical protein F2873_09005 [Actinobacteria bacterium]|nr:hypothetical protein [Actinomycetota bacterium]MSX78916.1 hypothetical protein [Actinomycetota bacterium]